MSAAAEIFASRPRALASRPESNHVPLFGGITPLSAVYVRRLQTLGALRDLELYALALLEGPEP